MQRGCNYFLASSYITTRTMHTYDYIARSSLHMLQTSGHQAGAMRGQMLERMPTKVSLHVML